nr:transposase [Enterococcus sp. DIV1298c]
MKDRIYHCNKCGYTADRDHNASLNLASYSA